MSDSKQYRVHEGVAWVNGARVPDDRMVRLTEAEARFDLEQGRIEPGDTPVVQSSGKAGRRAGAAAVPLGGEDAADDGRD